jgi:hypothetical protein
MPRVPFVSIAAVGFFVVMTQSARGELPSMGRYLGVGWGDGYHSGTACPPKRHIAHHSYGFPVPATAPTETPIPWWKIPAVQPEELPAPKSNAATTSFPPSGPSLFRQPGEGSSVAIQPSAGATTASR